MQKKLLMTFGTTLVHSAVSLTTRPQPLPKPVLYRVRSSASSFSFQCHLVSWRVSSSCVRLLPYLRVTLILPYIFPSITCFRRQVLHKMWPIQFAFLLFTVCMMFLCSLTVCITTLFLTRSVQLIFSILLQHQISHLSRYFWYTFRNVQVSALYKATYIFE